MISDNVADLFAAPGPAVRFRQGTITAWNPLTGANTIDVAGGTLSDVPILNTGEAIALKAGHIVGMLAFGNSWFILGRITPPGDPNFAGASLAFAGTLASATNFSVTTANLDKVTASLTVPAWADEALVTMTSQISLANTNAASGYYATAQPYINGVGGGGIGFGIGPFGNAAFTDLVSGSVGHQLLIADPGPTISLSTKALVTSGTLAASPTSTVILTASAIFRSTV